LRILVVTPSYPPKIGGGERYAQAMAQQALAAGHQVTVVTTDVSTNEGFWRWQPRRTGTSTIVEEGITVVRCPCLGLPGGWPALTLWRKAMVLFGALGQFTAPALDLMSRCVPRIRGMHAALAGTGGIDLIHAYNLSWEYPLILASSLSASLGIPLVVTPFAHLGPHVSAKATRNITMPHQLRILERADAILALTSAEASGLISFGIDPKRVHVVGSGFDGAPASAVEPVWLSELRGPLVLFVGRISPDKGAIVSAQAILSLKDMGASRPTLVLLGPVDDAFRRYYAGLRDEERSYVRLVGPVSEAEKHAALDRSSMLVLPSRVDAFGMVFLEAWAHGKPVIGARAGGIPGLIDDGVDGVLVPWGDAEALAQGVRDLLSDPSLAEQLGAAGRRKTSCHYTWEAVGAQVNRIYEQMVVGRGQLPGSEGPSPCG